METAGRELGTRLSELIQSVRLIKQHRADVRPAVPVGLAGLLMQIEQLPAGCHARESGRPQRARPVDRQPRRRLARQRTAWSSGAPTPPTSGPAC